MTHKNIHGREVSVEEIEAELGPRETWGQAADRVKARNETRNNVRYELHGNTVTDAYGRTVAACTNEDSASAALRLLKGPSS